MSLYTSGPLGYWSLNKICFVAWGTPAISPAIRSGLGVYRVFLYGHGIGVQLT